MLIHVGPHCLGGMPQEPPVTRLEGLALSDDPAFSLHLKHEALLDEEALARVIRWGHPDCVGHGVLLSICNRQRDAEL